MNANYTLAIILAPLTFFAMEPPEELLTDATVTDSLGFTPLHYLALYDTSGFAINGLCKKKNIDINAQDKLGCTPLAKAAAQGNFSAVKVLIAHNALLNKTNNAGKTALHCALYCHDEQKAYEIIALLLEKGARVDVPDKHGWSPYHVACWKQKERVARLLVKHGALENKVTKDNKVGTVLHQEGYLLQRFPKLYRNYVLNSLAPKKPQDRITPFAF